MPISKRKLEANRANAKKSTGPKSAAGRETVSQNRRYHGLVGNFTVLSCEEQADFDHLFERFLETEKPIDDVERELVLKMARHTWMSERAVRCQNGCFLVQPRTKEDEDQRVHGVAVRTDLDLYLRYQAAHDRAYARASAELAKRRKERQLEARGFERQKREQAQEERRQSDEYRREKREFQHDERHQIAVALGKKRVELVQMQCLLAADKAADILSAFPPDQLAQMTQMVA